MLIADIMFYAFAVALVLAALMVISVKNPVHSVLFLIFAFFNAAGLFVLLGAEFIAMLLVIVYVGAVAVLFLFVVMMLNVNFMELKSGFVKYVPACFLVAVAILAELFFVIHYSLGSNFVKSNADVALASNVTNTVSLGMVLYTKYVYPFQLAGIILLVAMVGAIVLTGRNREDSRRQNVTKQVLRSRQDSIEIVKVQSGKGV